MFHQPIGTMNKLKVMLLPASILWTAAHAQPGTLDPTFGNAGKVLTDIGSSNENFDAVVVQTDGRIVSAGGNGYAFPDWGCYTLMRHNTDGSLDGGFGGDGIVSTNLNAGDTDWTPYSTGNNSRVTDLALLPDGRLLAVGRSFTVISGSGWNRLSMARYLPDGSLDPTFSADGWLVELDYSIVDAFVALMDDGRFVVAAGHGFGEFHVFRYHPDGTIDVSFAGTGHVTHQVGIGSNMVRGVGVMADGRIIVGGSFMGVADDDVFLVRFSSDGTVDATYNGTGEVTSAPGIYHDELNDMMVQADGTVIAVGTSVPTPWTLQWLLQRFLPDGSPDVTFAGTGTLIHEAAVDGGDLQAVAVRSDGEIIVAGSRYVAGGGSSEPVTAAFTDSGALDAAFGAGGYCVHPFTPDVFHPGAIALGSNDQVAVAGNVSIDGMNVIFDMGVVSISPTGTLDAAFNGTGTVTQDAGIGGDFGNAVAMQQDGKLLVASETQIGGLARVLVTRYHVDGSIDPTFGVNGNAQVPITRPASIAVQPDGGILIGDAFMFTLARLNSAGSIDLGFNGLGSVTIMDFLGSNNFGAVRGIAVQPDGKIVAAGFAGIVGGGRAFALARFNPDGSLDPGFGGDGKVVTDLAFNNWEEIEDMALMPDGRIVATGYAETAEGFVVARYEADGDPDPTFGGGDGIINHTVTGYYSRSKSIALRTDGRILLAGDSQDDLDPSNHDITLMQLLPGGALDGGFGSGGQVTMDIGAMMQEITALVLQADGKALAAGYAKMGVTADFLLLRYDITGALDPTFGTGGSVTTDFGPYTDQGRDLLIQPDAKAVVVGFAFTSSDLDIALARYDLGTIIGMPEQGFEEMGLRAWPSPLTHVSVASFTLRVPTSVNAGIYDAQGRLALNLVAGAHLPAGTHQIPLDGAQQLASGPYTLILRTSTGMAKAMVVR